VDGTPIPWNASVREFQRGRAGYIVEALEQPLLLPKDMEAYRRFTQNDLILSLKRDLAMVNNLSTYKLRLNHAFVFYSYYYYYYYFFVVFGQITQQVFVAEEWYRDACKQADAEALTRADA